MAGQQGVVADDVGGQAQPGQVLGSLGAPWGERHFGTTFFAKLVVFEMEKLILLARNWGVKLRQKIEDDYTLGFPWWILEGLQCFEASTVPKEGNETCIGVRASYGTIVVESKP